MDPHILRRILVNLLSNAIKYSPQGGEVRLSLSRVDDEVRFEVSDQGMGIPAKDQPHIFDAFHRAENTRNVEGTGLGMAIVYENVMMHGGRIDLWSKEGEGTRITVHLPPHDQGTASTCP